MIIFAVESGISKIIISSEKYGSKFNLFNTNGANPKINGAYAKRRGLKSLGTINVFISSIVVGRNMIFGS